MTTPPTARPARYRIVVYERDNEHDTVIMDATANGFIAAAATIYDDHMYCQLGDRGPRHLQHHIALLIADQHDC